ncbi:MAG: kynurenine 3-monooxygenase, mitochondrial precursor [Sarcosagium campestre]|nr:MAG: kynurenine 3-monooxygenase, mitochondrial precursor [Sarcosagium campestre]
MTSGSKQKTLIIGAGPVGALAAIYAARRGDEVELYELRGDLRLPSTTPLNFTKSINLALSERGINSIRQAECPNLLKGILGETIPMRGRMIHGIDKNGILYEVSQNYDVLGKEIHAVDRAGLNKRLLDELEALSNVKLFFNHKLVGVNMNKNIAWFEKTESATSSNSQTKEEVEVAFDFMIGADGAHSAVRYHMMKFARVDYQQEYIDTLWCEFVIPPSSVGAEGDFKMSPNHLHIWPAGDFMFIAIPSLDRSFTCTLFLSATHFSTLESSPSKIIDFFGKYFPGVTPNLISPSSLQAQFQDNPHLPLVSIKCKPYHYRSCVIVGDAAHAMVPFYGQGMNAGLEDVRVLFEILGSHAASPTSPPDALLRALEDYTLHRAPDAHAINDLALQNYTEMRASVKSPVYLARKWIEEMASLWLPGLGWRTQYSRV